MLAVDDDGLGPFFLEPVGDESRADGGARTRPERQHEAHRMAGPLPGATRRRGERMNRQRETARSEAKPAFGTNSPQRPGVDFPGRSMALGTMAFDAMAFRIVARSLPLELAVTQYRQGGGVNPINCCGYVTAAGGAEW